MNRFTVSCFTAGSLVLVAAACSDDAPPARNPDKLWLALDGSEIQVRLIGSEPAPF